VDHLAVGLGVTAGILGFIIVVLLMKLLLKRLRRRGAPSLDSHFSITENDDDLTRPIIIGAPAVTPPQQETCK
jgi:hypothetical protein